MCHSFDGLILYTAVAYFSNVSFLTVGITKKHNIYEVYEIQEECCEAKNIKFSAVNFYYNQSIMYYGERQICMCIPKRHQMRRKYKMRVHKAAVNI